MFLDYTPGDLVINPNSKDWGIGQVQSVINNKITVNFVNVGKKVINGKKIILERVKKIIISANSTFNLINHRVGLINALLDEGYEVVAISPIDEFAFRLKELECHHVPLQMERKGTSIVRDLLLFFRYRILLKKHMPDMYLGFTVKPNIYGSLAAQSLGIPVINNISGLGTVFGAMSSTLVGNLLCG